MDLLNVFVRIVAWSPLYVNSIYNKSLLLIPYSSVWFPSFFPAIYIVAPHLLPPGLNGGDVTSKMDQKQSPGPY